jgi:hypothetical protein
MVFNKKKKDCCPSISNCSIYFLDILSAINKALYAFTIFPDWDKVVKERLSLDSLHNDIFSNHLNPSKCVLLAMLLILDSKNEL